MFIWVNDMATLQTLITDTTKLLKLEKGGTVFQFNSMKDENTAVMYDGSEHAMSSTGWELYADPVDFDFCRTDCKRQVDLAAGAARARYVTDAPGQDAVYLDKKAEAIAFKDAGYPEAEIANYPYMNAEKIAQGFATGQEAADSIIAIAAGWAQLAASIEQARLSGKNSIDAAGDDDAAIEAAALAAIAILDAI